MILYGHVSNIEFHICFQLINDVPTPYTTFSSVCSATYDKVYGSNYVTAYGKYVSYRLQPGSLKEVYILGAYPNGNAVAYTGVQKTEAYDTGTATAQYETITGTIMSVLFSSPTVQDCVIAI